MMKKAIVILMALGTIGRAAAQEPEFLARFKGAVGVIPASSGTGTANADGTLPNVRVNAVRGVSPAPGPWTIADFRADVDVDGRVRATGRGLLLAGGNSVGTNGSQSVFATLICETAAPFTERSSSESVPLEPNGDFRIDDTLAPVPAECASPVLLIRAKNGTWLAAGIPNLRADD